MVFNKSTTGGGRHDGQEDSSSPEPRPKRFRTGISSLFRPSTLRATTTGSATLRVSPEPPADVQLPIRAAPKTEPPAPSAGIRPPGAPPAIIQTQTTATFSDANSSSATSQSHLGPIELCSGGDNPTVDIVFVHGLKGHAFHTWEKRGFMWPKHLLGAKYPTARIITYGYDADIVKLFGRVEKGTIFDRSKAMIQAIHRIRRDNYQRPLLFVAHSLGGILVKDGLCWAKAQAGFSAVKVNEVYSATKGVIFLGTPHRGASGQYATVGEQLRRLVKIAGQESDPYLLAGLKSDSEGLTRISESFHLLADDKTFLIFSFVESKPLSAVKGMGFVVDRNSGYMGLAREAQDEIPDADHREMARFSSKDEEGYKKVEDAVGHCIDFATEKVDDDWVSVPEVAKNTGSYELIYEFTANSQHKSDIQILRSGRLDGTCEWISEQVAFQNWISGSIKFLLLVGAAGAGKSHVFAKVIDLLNERYQKPCRGDTTTPLSAYYFCRTPTKKKTLTNGLKSMIGQLAYLDDAFANELSVRWDRHRSYDGDTAPTIAWLWQNLLTGSRALAKRTSVYLVVDGLDECDEAERRDFLESAYLHCAEGTGPVIQVFCSGRPEVKADMSQIMDSHMHNLDVPTIEVSWQTKSDIELLIGKKMTRVKFKDKALRTKVTEAIANDANGSFLWTDLTLKEFINAKSSVEVDSALGRMRANATLDDMYQGIMDTLIKGASEIQVKTFKCILTWLIYGSDIMRYAMLEEAVEKAVGTKIFALSDEIERFGSVMELGSFQRLRLPSAGLEAAGTGAAWASPHSNTFARSLAEDSDDEEGDEDIFNDDGTGITGDEEVRIRHATFQKWYADVLDHDSPIYSSSNDAHVELLRVCLETLVQYRISADEHPRLLAHARDAWVEHFMRVDWQDVENDALWPVARDLRTLFTDWPITRAWLGDASFLKWMEQRTRLETALKGFLGRVSTLEAGGTVVQAWAQGLYTSLLPPLEALADATLRTAEAGGFFTNFPAIGSDNMDTSLIMRGLLFIYEIAASKTRIDPATFLKTSSEKYKSAFWAHSIWSNHLAMFHYTVAEMTDEDDFDEAELYYHGAFEAEPDQAVIPYQLASLYKRQGMLDHALTIAGKAVQLCANRADARALSESRLLVARIHDSLGDQDRALEGYKVVMSLGNPTAVDLLASYYAGLGTREGIDNWYKQYVEFARTQNMRLEETFAEAILRQPTYSEWHTNFVAASKLNNSKMIIKAYKQAIRLSKSKNDSRLVQCGCRFHLAQAYSKRPQQRAKAIPLWTWTLNYLTRFKSFWEGADDGTQNRLFTLTIEELSVSQALSLSHPLIFFAENIDLVIFDYSRIMIMLGTGIERQAHLQDDAFTLYRRVLKRAVKMALSTGLQNQQIRMVLGDCLMALKDFRNAARSLSWACNYRDAVAPRILPSAQDAETAQASTSAQQPAQEQNLHTRISWYTLCDMCMAKRSYRNNMEIFGYRYKCLVCGELDLCEPCYESWKGSRLSRLGTDSSAVEELPGGGALRQCSVDHDFMKLPSPDWPEIESEARMITDGGMPKSVPAWLLELADKFELDIRR